MSQGQGAPGGAAEASRPVVAKPPSERSRHSGEHQPSYYPAVPDTGDTGTAHGNITVHGDTASASGAETSSLSSGHPRRPRHHRRCQRTQQPAQQATATAATGDKQYGRSRGGGGGAVAAAAGVRYVVVQPLRRCWRRAGCWWGRCCLLLWRAAVDLVRTPGLLLLHCVLAVLAGVVVGVIFLHQEQTLVGMQNASGKEREGRGRGLGVG